jgi:hypothetical protein
MRMPIEIGFRLFNVYKNKIYLCGAMPTAFIRRWRFLLIKKNNRTATAQPIA